MATLALAVAGQVVGGALGGPIGATIGRALGALAGSAVDDAVFGARPKPGPAGADIRLQGSSEGGAVPRLYGWGRLAGNVIWATELEQVAAESHGGKGTSRSAESDPPQIVASFAVAFCEGEVSRLGRVWADGQLLETEGLNLRFYRGTETQGSDSLIEAVQGADNAPAYRGLCYLVFERLPIGPFGNRIPAISVELCRVVGALEPAIRAVTVIPGATEFGYDPSPRVRVVGPGSTALENTHQSQDVSDWTLSIDELCDLCPNLTNVSLVVAWFGDDLRCGHCTIRPKVESASRNVKGTDWSVAGLGRGAAGVVSTYDGGPAYGGTPSDAAVRAAIADLRRRGLSVTLYPMILMDIAEANAMGQPAYPWRGRIGGEPGSDGTAAAASEVAAFVGTSGGWGFRRFVRHYATLAAETGCDALILGSELRGLTTLRDGMGGFPFVAALRTLAAEARGIVGGGVKLTYAADWSEYSGYQPPGAPGDRLFHLDPLWADDNIDAVGIDNYMPAADWRDGEDAPDAGWGSPYDPDGLAANIAGGEGFDWYYATEADRVAGLRTPIADGAYDEPWVWRFKDIAGWWSNAHHDRVGGVRSATSTDWAPGRKPVWFTELGCAAVDKGANQPNVFPDSKSADGGRPYFSTGAPDPLMQRQLLRAHLAHWSGAANPVSGVYGGPMVDPERIYLWTWDARPFPAFPNAAATWRDAENYPAGHWLTGRLGGMASDELIAAIAADYGVDVDRAEASPPFATGLVVDAQVAARDALAPLLEAAGLGIADRAEGLAFRRPRAAPDAVVEAGEIVAANGPRLGRRRPDAAEAIGRLALNYTDRARDYLNATVTAIRLEPGAASAAQAGLSLDAPGARVAAEQILTARAAAAETLEFALPPSRLAVEVGDTLAVDGQGEGPFVVNELRDTDLRRVSAGALPAAVRAAIVADTPRGVSGAVVARAAPVLVAAQLPPDQADAAASRLLLAAWANPWPGPIEVMDDATGARVALLSRGATLGELAEPLAPGPVERWDGQGVEVEFYGGHVASVDGTAALAGANRLALVTDAGGWELIGFSGAELVAPGTYRLTRLLRGLSGSDPAMGPASAGNRVVLLDDAALMLPVPPTWLGGAVSLRAYAGSRDATGTALTAPLGLDPLLPLPPCHLSAIRDGSGDVLLSWTRRSRADADGWALTEVPLDSAPESYAVTILDGAEVLRTLAVGSPSATYTAAEQAADFGALPDHFDFGIAQASALYGPGHRAAGSFDG
jgi:hypothetical protein